MPKPSSRHLSDAGPQSIAEVCTTSGTNRRRRLELESALTCYPLKISEKELATEDTENTEQFSVSSVSSVANYLASPEACLRRAAQALRALPARPPLRLLPAGRAG